MQFNIKTGSKRGWVWFSRERRTKDEHPPSDRRERDERPKGERAKPKEGNKERKANPKQGNKERKAFNSTGKTQKRQLTSLVFFDLPNLYKKIDITLLC